MITVIFIGLFGIALGGSLLLMGTHALLSQDTFLRLYNKLQKRAQFGLKPFDVGYFGGPSHLRLIGLFLCVVGLFIIVSFCAISLDRLR